VSRLAGGSHHEQAKCIVYWHTEVLGGWLTPRGPRGWGQESGHQDARKVQCSRDDTRINGTFKPLGLKKNGQGVLLMGDKRGNWFNAIAEHWSFERWFRLLSGSRGVVQSAGLIA
jgi:hypothetical protein